MPQPDLNIPQIHRHASGNYSSRLWNNNTNEALLRRKSGSHGSGNCRTHRPHRSGRRHYAVGLGYCIEGKGDAVGAYRYHGKGDGGIERVMEALKVHDPELYDVLIRHANGQDLRALNDF